MAEPTNGKPPKPKPSSPPPKPKSLAEALHGLLNLAEALRPLIERPDDYAIEVKLKRKTELRFVTPPAAQKRPRG